MNGFVIAAIIIACLLLLIIAVLMLPLDIIINGDSENGVNLLFKVLFKRFGEESKPENAVGRKLKGFLGISRIKDKSAVKKKADTSGISLAAGQIIDIVMTLAGRVVWLLKRCRVKKLHILSVSGGDDAADAAMDYGMVCSFVYPLVGYLDSVMRVKPSATDIDIRCDYNSNPKFEINIIFSVRLIHFLRALLFAIRKNFGKEFFKEAAHEH